MPAARSSPCRRAPVARSPRPPSRSARPRPASPASAAVRRSAGREPAPRGSNTMRENDARAARNGPNEGSSRSARCSSRPARPSARRSVRRRRPGTRCAFRRRTSRSGRRAPAALSSAAPDAPGKLTEVVGRLVHGREAARDRGEAGPGRARPRRQGGRPGAARRRLRGDLHGSVPDAGADRRGRDGRTPTPSGCPATRART